MKRNVAALVLAWMSFTASVANADQAAFGFTDDSPRALFYFHQPFGALPGRDSALTFGLRLERTLTDFDAFEPRPAGRLSTAFPIGDFRFTLGGDYRLFTGGALMYDSEESGSFGTPDSWRNGWFWTGATLLVVGASCLADYWPCEDSERYNPPEESPGLDR